MEEQIDLSKYNNTMIKKAMEYLGKVRLGGFKDKEEKDKFIDAYKVLDAIVLKRKVQVHEAKSK